MNVKEFFLVIAESAKNIFRNPVVVLPGIFLFLFFFVFSKIGGKIAYSLETTIKNIAWTGFSWLMFLLVGGFVSAGLIGICLEIVKKKKVGNSFFVSVRKNWFSNFLVLLIIGLLIAFTFLIHFILRNIISSPDFFRIVALIVSFAWLICFVIFFTFSNFFIVVHGENVKNGIKSSFGFVKKEYLAVLALNIIIFFILPKLIALIPGIFGEIINFVIVLPLVFLILTRFVVEFDSK